MHTVCLPLYVVLAAGLSLAIVGAVLSAVGVAMMLANLRGSNSYLKWVERQKSDCGCATPRKACPSYVCRKLKRDAELDGVFRGIDRSFKRFDDAFSELGRTFDEVDEFLSQRRRN